MSDGQLPKPRGRAGANGESARLWSGLAAGDQDAMGEIVDRYWAPLVAFATRLVSDEDVAQDIVQDSLRRLWMRRERWRPGSLESLLYRMVRNGAADHRKSPWHQDRVADMDVATVHGPSALQPEHSIDASELDRAIDAAIAKLPLARREVFLLVRMTSLSYAEIAQLLDLAPQTVANHMRLALADLRKALADYV